MGRCGTVAGMRRDQRLGLTIGTTFGLVFVLVNAAALPSPWSLALRVAGVVAFLAVQLAIWAAAQHPVSPASAGAGGGFTRGFWVVVALEVVALIGGIRVIAGVFDAPEAGVAWVAVVVGLHFSALAVVWAERSLHVLAAALTACGTAGLLLAATGAGEAAIATVGGVLPGFVLIAGGLAAAVQASRLQEA